MGRALYDQLDALTVAADDEGTGAVTLALWAARVADMNGDADAAAEWTEKAAHGLGRLF